jgi:hypothetical protein
VLIQRGELGQGEVLQPGAPASSTPQASSTPNVPETAGGTSTAPGSAPQAIVTDIPYQPQLSDPPAIVKGIYLTNWTAGYEKRLASLEALVGRTELNAMVIDVKDYSGYVAYRTGIPDFLKSGAENDIRISKPNTLIKRLHDKGIYLIARISVFQDSVLAKAHPEWAVMNGSSGKVWTDRKGLAWLDAAAEPVWDYHIALASDALARGFDEVNFDYIRFPSDGDLAVATYPFWDEKTARHKTIAKFFAYVREKMPGAKLSADLFGLTTSASDDLGIGQRIEDGYQYFDFVSPMVYPSHFASGYGGYKNPASNPYEVIKLSMEAGLRKLTAHIEKSILPEPASATSTATSTPPTAPEITPALAAEYGKLRPWLQVFDLGAVYDAAKIDAQIRAADEVLGSTPHYAGWLLWDPSNNYSNYR